MNVTTIPNVATAVLSLAADVDTLNTDVVDLQDQIDTIAAAENGVILDPNATPGGNVYASFAAANAARIAAGPGTILYVAADVTAEAQAHNFTNLVLHGLTGGVPVVTFPDGASATWDASAVTVDFELVNVAIVWQGTAPFIEVPAVGLYVLLGLYSSIAATISTAAFIHVAAGRFVQIDVGEACQISGSSGHPVVQLATGGATGILFFGVRSTLSDNALTGGDAGAFTITDTSAGLTATGALASVSHTQTGTNTPTFDPP